MSIEYPPIFTPSNRCLGLVFANIYLLTSFWSCGKISAVKQLRRSSRSLAGLFCRLLGEKLHSSS